MLFWAGFASSSPEASNIGQSANTGPQHWGPKNTGPSGAPKILAGVEGVEPANAGIKIRCLNQLGDTPTQVHCFFLNLSNRQVASADNQPINRCFRKHMPQRRVYQPAKGCASRLLHVRTCQSPGATASVIACGKCAHTALPEPVMRPCKCCMESQSSD